MHVHACKYPDFYTYVILALRTMSFSDQEVRLFVAHITAITYVLQIKHTCTAVLVCAHVRIRVCYHNYLLQKNFA